MFTVPEVTILRLSAIFWHHADPKLCSLVYEYFSKLNLTVWQFEPLKTAFEKYLWGWKFFKSIYLHLCVDKEHLGFSLATWKLSTFISPHLFLCQTVCLVIVCGLFIGQHFFMVGLYHHLLHLNVDGNQLGLKKVPVCMCGCSPNVEKIFETGWWEHSEPSQQFPTKVRPSNGQRDCKEPTSYISDSTGLS